MSSSYTSSSAPFAPSMDTFRPMPPVRSDLPESYQDEPLLPPPVPERNDRSTNEHTEFKASVITDAVDAGLRRRDCSCNYNRYATKKTIGHGFLEFALITSNAMQLRTLIVQKHHDGIWVASLILVCISILAQIGLAYILVILAKGDVQNPNKQEKLEKFNNIALFVTMLISMINVIINVFMSTTNPQSYIDPTLLNSLQTST